MTNKELIEKIKEALTGIDQTETESEAGWWETSAGAKFGQQKLEAVLKLIEEFTNG